MIQGSTEWLNWRMDGIGSSDAPAIMGKSPYSTRADVLLDKLGQAKPMAINPAMALGTKWEPAARALHYFETELDMQPAELVHPEFDYIRASLDGYLPKLFFLEIKYMGEKNFELVTKSQRPLEHHWIQMQHQFLVSNLSAGTYIPYILNEDKTKIEKIAYIPVAQDGEYCEKLFIELNAFWMEVLECRAASQLYQS